ncbi:hypothetical protein SS50377_24919 [Spironucleus salmonicida]|uniref:Peptidase C1A papain C-terminal domain-containing protein n=1 Tax=Spironucleus salmonicida TaxID=348837 RepID=V6LFW7_9EUKA|nr:hypothetical protein SS50377_24919 [Spironucleus salmonicida]|eukprot:EST43450.1 Hypothetical protein SS50377_16813 [Spironucleus salmonicida]
MLIILNLAYSFNGTIASPDTNFSTTLNVTSSKYITKILISSTKLLTYENGLMVVEFIKINRTDEIVEQTSYTPVLYPTDLSGFQLISSNGNVQIFQKNSSYPPKTGQFNIHQTQTETITFHGNIPKKYEIVGLDPIFRQSYGSYVVYYDRFELAFTAKIFSISATNTPQTNSTAGPQQQLFCNSSTEQALALALSLSAAAQNQSVTYSAQAFVNCVFTLRQFGCAHSDLDEILRFLASRSGHLPLGGTYLALEGACDADAFTDSFGILRTARRVPPAQVPEKARAGPLLVSFCAPADFGLYHSGIVEVNLACEHLVSGVITGVVDGVYVVRTFVGSFATFQMSQNSEFLAYDIQVAFLSQRFSEVLVVFGVMAVAIVLVFCVVLWYLYYRRQQEVKPQAAEEIYE